MFEFSALPSGLAHGPSAGPVTVSIASAVAVVGLVVGSFLTVVVDRVPDRRPLWLGRSSCSSCGHVLGPTELVPVVSWVAQRGRCRRCGRGIGAWVPALEGLTSMSAVAVVARFGTGWDATAVAVTVATLLAQSTIDLRVRRLPREISYPAFVGVAVVFLVAAIDRGTPGRLVAAGVGAVLMTAALGFVRHVSRGGMGDGDVRLAPLLGLVVGWWDVTSVFVVLLIASALGATVGVVPLLRGRRRVAVPFGPCLAIGTVAVLWA